MKKVLQQTLFRLKTFLLLAVMFIVGSSAHAQIELNLTGGGATSQVRKSSDNTVTFSYNQENGRCDIYNSYWTGSLASTEFPIESIEVVAESRATELIVKNTDTGETCGTWSGTGTNATWTANPGVEVKKLTFSAPSGDIYLTKMTVSLSTGKTYADFNHSSANAGSKGWYTISSDVITFDSPVTVLKNPTIDGNSATATSDGNNLNISFTEIETAGTHTLTFAKGTLQQGENYNNEFSISYTLDQDPSKPIIAKFNFNGVAIPYTTGGNPSTLTSGKDLAVGDVFESQGVTMTFTATALAWSNSAQRLRLGQNTAFTIAAPEGYEITNIDFKTDQNSINLSWIKGLNTPSYTNVTWSGNEVSLDFRASYDTWIQTIDVTCVKLSDVEYEVDIYKGAEPADADWTVTIKDIVGTFKNGDTFNTGKKITESDVVAPHHDGYHEAEVEIEEMAGTMFITVTYAVFEPINYTVDFSDNAPAGATVTIDGQEFSGDDTYPVAKDLDYYSVTDVNAPAGWYADYSYNEGSHTFTFDFKQYINYSVVVEGAPAGQGGVVYNGDTYGAGENVINAKTALTESSVSVADVDGYAGTVSLDDHTFTVSYKKETIVVVPVGSGFNSVVEGITFKAQQENSEVNLYSNGTGYLDLSTTDLNMVKIQLVCNYSSFTASSGDGNANLYNLGQYVYVLESEDMGSITSSGQNVEWTGSTKHIRFTAPYDFHVTNIKVWVEEAEVEPRSNVMDVASTYFSTGNVEQINSNLTFVADVNTEGEHSGAYGSSTEVPDGVTLKDGNGTSYTISSMLWWDNGTQVAINLPSAITAPGHYTLIIPEGVIPCVGNKANKEIVFEWTIAEPTTYTVTFADGAPAGASVTIDGNTYTENTTFPSRNNLDENSANVKDVEGYEGSVAYDSENKEFTITYTALPTYDYYVTIYPAEDTDLKIRIDGKEYGDSGEDTYTFYKELTEGDIVLPEYPGYYPNPSIVINNTSYTITVTYTALPSLAIGSNATDRDGNYWTSFCLDKAVSFPADVTPCIVTGAENGKLTLEEFPRVSNEITTKYDFENNAVEEIMGNLYCDGDNHDVTMSYSGVSVYQSIGGKGYLKNEGTLNISCLTTPITKVIVKPWGWGTGANISLNGADPVAVADGDDTYIFDVNSYSCTLDITNYNGGVYLLWIEVVTSSGETVPVIPANTGILVKSAAPVAKILYAIHEDGEVNTDVSDNILSASGETGFIVKNDADNLYYKLTLNAASEPGSAGFYWDKNSDEGHSITVPAHKAYLKLSASAGSNRAAYHFGSDDILTDIEAVETEADNAPVYNLQGQRVNAQKAGVYVKNGRKFIVK